MRNMIREDNIFKIYAHNMQGIPNGLNKSNKLKEFNRRIRDQDMVMILETGVNMEK